MELDHQLVITSSGFIGAEAMGVMAGGGVTGAEAGAIAGGEVGGFCGPAAPVCVAGGVIIGGALGYFSGDYAFHRIFR